MKKSKSIVFGFVAAFAGCAFAGTANAEEKRMALVLANQDYPSSVGELTNTHQDAATVENALKSIGFQVTKVLDKDTRDTKKAITDFELAIEQEAADGDDVIVFIYASMHGIAVQDDGKMRNFLLPAKTDFPTPGTVIEDGIRIDKFVRRINSTSAKGLIFVSDACRNELKKSYSKSISKGFVRDTTSKGIVVYATAEGSTTPDDGLFARVLASELQEDGRRASFAMLETVEEVAKQREDRPIIAPGDFPSWFCFSECPSEELSEVEAIALGEALSSNSVGKLQEFQDRFPESNFLKLIEAKKNKVGPKMLKLTIKRIDCLLADDEGPFNEVDMNRMYVHVRLPGEAASSAPTKLYDHNGKSKKFSTGDSMPINKSVEFEFDPRLENELKLSAFLRDNDDLGDPEIGRLNERAFPIDRLGREQSFNVSSRDFSFNIVYQFDEL